MKFSIREFVSICDRPNPQETVNLFTFTAEILNGKLYFLCSVFKCITLFKGKQKRKDINLFRDSPHRAPASCGNQSVELR